MERQEIEENDRKEERMVKVLVERRRKTECG